MVNVACMSAHVVSISMYVSVSVLLLTSIVIIPSLSVSVIIIDISDIFSQSPQILFNSSPVMLDDLLPHNSLAFFYTLSFHA